MDYQIIDLNDEQVADIENLLDEYDRQYIKYQIPGNIKIGIFVMTAFKILYVSTVFVDERYRGQKIGSLLMEEVEKRAKILGANMIRLDTFNWQGREFYRALGYEEVGTYENKIDGFSEHFFLKRL